MIIAFANQKGGVGKTTLCMLFANYLVKKGANVLVVDVDMQKSIKAQRISDSEAFTEQEEEYNVEVGNIDTLEDATALVNTCKQLDGVVLLDTPGNITEDGLLPIFQNADYIICPYQYERKCLESTGVFMKVIEKLKAMDKSMKSQTFYVPNNIDSRYGKKEEKELWNQTDEIFNRFGLVTPIIPYKASLKRVNTYYLSDAQEMDVKACFDYIIEKGKIL